MSKDNKNNFDFLSKEEREIIIARRSRHRLSIGLLLLAIALFVYLIYAIATLILGNF